MNKKQIKTDFKTITGIKPGKTGSMNTAGKIHHELKSAVNTGKEIAETGIDLFLEKTRSATRPAIDHTGSKNISGLDIKKGNLLDNSSSQKTYNTKKDFRSVYITKK